MKGYLPLAMFALAALTGCEGKKEAEVSTNGIDLANLDTTAVRGDDFYQYACGGWMKNHPLSDEYARFGSFDQLSENNREQIKGLITELASKEQAAGSVAQKVADVYKLAMDSDRLNKEGFAPAKTDFDEVTMIKDKSEVIPMMTKMFHKSIAGYFNYGIDADMMNSKNNLFQIGQGGLSLGQKDYYIDTDSATVNIREKFKQHIINMFKLAGVDEATAQKNMEAVMEIETRIAKASFSNVELRDPAANYHKMTIDELKKTITGIDWDMFLDGVGVKGKVNEVSVGQIEPVKEVAKIINEVPLEKQIAYFQWNVIDGAANTLSDEFQKEHFDFYSRTMRGTKEMQPRWKRAVNAVNGTLGEAVGQMYVQKYFPASAKERMVQLIKNLQTALGERIQAQEWMSDTTKTYALDKLNAFYVKVGYPDKWRDYSSLNIDAKDSYYENMKRAGEFEINYMLSKAGKPVDRDEWYMTPQTVNAYYNPTTNEICFPAGILQYPFFDMNADDAFNYGAIGVVIGHEMTHGFDDQGRQFDKEGNFRDWWTPQDAERFKERTKVMADFFSNIEVLPGLKGNGELTLGENLADHGGLNVSFQAFKNATKDSPLGVVDGFTPEQRFFLAYAGVWAQNIRENEIRVRTKSDPHALGMWRVNGALPHIQAWYDAFGITEKDKMYIAPEKRVNIW